MQNLPIFQYFYPYGGVSQLGKDEILMIKYALRIDSCLGMLTLKQTTF